MQEVERALLHAFANAEVKLAGARVLDIGCGSGYWLNRLREFGARDCHGIDLMENRIENGKHHYPPLKLQVASATELPFEDAEFDLVTQFTCLSSIIDPDVRLAAAREMRRVAGSGWVLSFDMRGLRRPGSRSRGGGTPTVALDERELRRLFGSPTLLRREALSFELAQITGWHPVLASTLAALRPLRSHLLGLWRDRS
jgi:SAM-dependent methyltransferase